MSYVKDPRVDAYIDPLPAWKREILSRVRDLVHEADPEVEETIKRTVQPYFVLDGTHLRLPCREGPRQRLPLRPGRCRSRAHHHERSQQQDRAGHLLPRGGDDQRAGAARAVQGDHREQPSRWLAKTHKGLTGPIGRPTTTRSRAAGRCTTPTSRSGWVRPPRTRRWRRPGTETDDRS